MKEYKGDWHAKDLNSYNHLLHLLFGQIIGCDSLRDICLCLEAHKKILYHLGFRTTVTKKPEEDLKMLLMEAAEAPPDEDES